MSVESTQSTQQPVDQLTSVNTDYNIRDNVYSGVTYVSAELWAGTKKTVQVGTQAISVAGAFVARAGRAIVRFTDSKRVTQQTFTQTCLMRC
jgi:hypothetical protein